MNLETHQSNPEYHPHFSNLGEIAEMHDKLTADEEVLEMAHLRFDLGIPTIKLFEQLKGLRLNDDNGNVIKSELTMACFANDEDVFQTSFANSTPFKKEEIDRLYKLAVDYYKHHAQS